MTFAHISDTHLGYRAYGRTDAQGFDVREVDVMRTFNQCLGSILEREPDVVVHSGDVFHVVRPSNETIVRTHQALTKFQEKRAAKPFVLIGGNHDSPRTLDSGNILRLFSSIPGIFVQSGKAEVLDDPAFERLGLEVLCVPSNSVIQKENVEYTPSLGRPYSLLTIHGIASQAMPEQSDFDVEDTNPGRWTYIALGDFHVHQTYGRNACYAGSTDFTSTNVWEESKAPKGWVWFDTEKAFPELVRMPTRDVLDLDPIDGRDLDGPGIADAMLANAVWEDEALPIVRQVVTNVHPEVRGKIPYGVFRDLNRRALTYRLDVRMAATTGDCAIEGGSAESLEASWTSHAAEANLPAGIERKAFSDLGHELMREALERETAPASA